MSVVLLLLALAADPSAQWPAINSQTARVSYHPAVSFEHASLAASLIESGAARIGQSLGLERSPAFMDARLYSTVAGYIEATGASSFFGATTKGGVIHMQPVSVLLDQGILERVVLHEVAHAYLKEAGGRHMPRWLEEGLATALGMESPGGQSEWKPATLDGLSACLKSRKTPKSELELCYGAAEALAWRMIERFGWLRVAELLAGLKAGSSFDGVSEKVLDLKPAELFEQLEREPSRRNP